MTMVLLLAIGLMAIAIIMIAVRMFFIKGGEFRGTCSSNNPLLKNEIGECTICGSKPGENCKGEENQSNASTITAAKP